MSDYTPTGNPNDATRYVSKEIRDEFTSIATAINSKRDLDGTNSVSTTSMTIADAQQTFVIETGKDLNPGMFVYIADAAAPTTNIMFGRLYSYNTTTGITVVDVSSHSGSGTKTSWVIGVSNENGVSLVSNSFTGHQNFARATVASTATTSNIWSASGNQIDFTGTATVTGFPAAAQAGSSRTLICAGTCSFTAGANMLIDGIGSGSTVTCAANDKVVVEAVTTTQFRLTRHRYDGQPQIGVNYSEVIVQGHNGFGSTNNKIHRYTAAKTYIGTAVTYADSAANGASFTINEPGLYYMNMGDYSEGVASHYGISVNSSQLTTSIESITATNQVMYSYLTASIPGSFSGVAKFVAGDVVRPHTDGTQTTGVGYLTFFSIIKLSST